jgi:multicomponent Na+:H+ antiporter subunit D
MTSGARHQVMAAATGALVVLGIVLAVVSGPLYDVAGRAASDLLHPDAYVAEVLGR